MTAKVSAVLLALAASAAAQAPSVEPPRMSLPDPHETWLRSTTGMISPQAGNNLFYLPTHDEPATPATWGFKFEDVGFHSVDGTPLHGWFIPSRATKAKGTVVFSHGNAGSLGHHLGFVLWFAEAGFNVLMYDYRGFGKSGGCVGRRGMVNDVKAAFTYVSKRRDLDVNRLVSYGHSLGGAQSVTAIGEAPVRGLRAVIIDGAFASYRTMARVIGGRLGESLVTDDLAPKDFVSKISPVPLLVVHGSNDIVVPVSQGRQLFRNAAEPKTMFEVKDGNHGDSLSRDQGEFRRKVITWLDTRLGG